MFLPSVSEIGKIVDLKDSDKVKAFLTDSEGILTRDSSQSNATTVKALYNLSRKVYYSMYANLEFGVRPAFVIDLSQVNYSVVK